MNFESDNAAGIAPAILQAIVRANEGFAQAYGEDAVTAALKARVAQLFEHEVGLYLVATGTAANALALAQVAPPWGAVLCHEECHLALDECGAPEFFGAGLKLIPLPGEGGKIAAPTLAAALSRGPWGGPHHVTPAVVSLTQATEFGTIYRPEEIHELSAIAHAHGLKVHVDGARFANALVRLDTRAAAASWQCGVDILSLGATKGGAMGAEAVVVFDRKLALGMEERRKRAGHLISKHRFMAAQLEAYLADDLWLALARHANRMADRLCAALADAGLEAVWPVEANEIFVVLPRRLDQRLRAAGARYCAWVAKQLPSRAPVGDDAVLVRLVASFATTDADVNRFVATIRED
jgi:threonine aldolase